MDELRIGLTIQKVADRTHVSVHTLRAWERRYRVPMPTRGAGNRYRLYDDQAIADVLWMKQQVEAGVAPAQAAYMLRQQHMVQPVSSVGSQQPIEATVAAFESAVFKADQVAAGQILDQAFGLYAPEQVVLEIITPAMQEIGERWLRNEMTVWHEHLASNLVRQKLLAILQAQPYLPSSARLVTAACAPEEDHELGLIMFALIARRLGWRTALLGQRTPLADMRAIVDDPTPDVLAISFSTVTGLTGVIPLLEAENRPNIPLVFGGRLLNAGASLRNHLPGDFMGEDALTGVRALAGVKLRNDFWRPAPRVLRVVYALKERRLQIAGETVARLMAAAQTIVLSKGHALGLNHATLYLLDTLACALAFDAPELVDQQRAWLDQAMPPRQVPPRAIAAHVKELAGILDRHLAKDDARLYKTLIARFEA